jgi:hypothetical protein
VAVPTVVGVAADHDQARGMAGAPQAAQRVEQGLQALDRREAADVEEERPARQPERRPRGVRIAGREEHRVDPARDDGDPGGIGAVGGHELTALDHVGRHQPVGAGDDTPLFRDAQHGLLLGGEAGAVLQPAQRVEHLHERDAPALAQRQPDHAGEPVVAVHEVVVDLLALPPRLHAGDELAEMPVHALARQRRLRARRQVDHARVLGQRHHARDGGVLRAREDVGGHAHPRQLARQLADVHVHPARLLAAERGERARVHAEQRDAEAHAGGACDGGIVGAGPARPA